MHGKITRGSWKAPDWAEDAVGIADSIFDRDVRGHWLGELGQVDLIDEDGDPFTEEERDELQDALGDDFDVCLEAPAWAALGHRRLEVAERRSE